MIPGGYDEQFYLEPELVAAADTAKNGRYPFEGRNELGTQLYETFGLEDMRVRVQSLSDIERPLPMSPYGDYLLIVGTGPRRECALLMLYRTDRWGFRADQIDWVDSVLSDMRTASPHLPLLAFGHDWTWFFPDTLDDGTIDGARNGIRSGSPQTDRIQKQRLMKSLRKFDADVAFASDIHAYWACIDDSLLRINIASAACYNPDGRRIALDNVWIEYQQSDTAYSVEVHRIEPPIGCGLRDEAAAVGIAFRKNRTAGSVWRKIKPEQENGD